MKLEGSSTLPHRHSSILPYIGAVKIESLVNANRMAKLKDAAQLARGVHEFCSLERVPVPFVHTSLCLFLSQVDAFRHFPGSATPSSHEAIACHLR